MTGEKKSACNNQWVSTPTDPNITGAEHRKKKTAGDNQWTSTNKNPIK
ncbi:MAG: hypothetical protein ACRC1T_02765 [Clostridium chrysemydis]